MTDQQTPPPEAGFFSTVRGWGLTRGDERVLGGVASGIAARLGWRLGWTRVGVLAVVLFVSGFGALAYAAAWALLPDREGRIIAQDFGRGVPNVGALIMIGIIALAGLFGLTDAGPWGWWPWNDGAWWPGDAGAGIGRAVAIIAAIMIPLVIVGAVVGLIVWLVRRDRAPRADDGTPPVYAAPPAWAAERQRQRAEAHAAGHAAADAATSAAHQAAAAAAATTWAATPAPPVVPPAPPRPPRPPRVPGPGAGFYLLTLAWVVLSAAGIAWAGWTDRLAVHPFIAWFALFVTGLGVILALVALSGRRLGFLAFASAVLLIPTAAMIVQADKVIDGWSDRWLPRVEVVRGDDGEVVRVDVGEGTITVGEDGGVTIGDPTVDEDPATEPTTEPDADPFDAFTADYEQITLPGSCYATDEAPARDAGSRGLVTATGLTDDRTVVVSADHTTVRMDAGTALEITAVGDTGGQVHWADRDVTCDLWGGEPTRLSVADEPMLTLRLTDPATYSTIVIEEVAS